MKPDTENDPASESPEAERRKLLQVGSNVAMLAGLAGSYGFFALIAARYLYPARPREMRWMAITDLDRLQVGQSLLYQAPSGEKINVVRRGREGTGDDFMALSSVCPHLGCNVHWESQNNRYFCPCHNNPGEPDGAAHSPARRPTVAA